jgi:hypothetical protein
MLMAIQMPLLGTTTGAIVAASPNIGGRTSSNGDGHHHRNSNSGPYQDKDRLLSLQLLAYLSKYLNVKQAFYRSRVTFHPASARYGVGLWVLA